MLLLHSRRCPPKRVHLDTEKEPFSVFILFRDAFGYNVDGLHPELKRWESSTLKKFPRPFSYETSACCLLYDVSSAGPYPLAHSLDGTHHVVGTPRDQIHIIYIYKHTRFDCKLSLCHCATLPCQVNKVNKRVRP